MHGTNARGGELLKGGRRFGPKPGMLTRIISPGARKILNKIDGGLKTGTLIGHLPDGSTVTLGGHAPGFECEVTVHDWRALMRLALGGSVGWYEAWAAGEWSSPDPVPLFALFMANTTGLGDIARAKGPWRLAAKAFHSLRANTPARAERNIHAHYDLGNDFYAAWLDPTMSYSSAIDMQATAALEDSQVAKWHRLSERVGDPDTVLEIGCGWGALSAYFAEKGCDVTAISLSDEQLEWARERYPDVQFRKQDYRAVRGRFDAIVSVEMVEALGREYWPDFMDCLARNLNPGGCAALQFITIREDVFDAYAASADFIQAYVFPGGMLICASEFRRLAEERGLLWKDQEDFGLDYAETLRAWRENFDRAVAEDRLPAGFDRGFCDLWRYYLQYCEGGFRGGGIDVSQVTLIKPLGGKG
ncbi:SAM-dependent methyltransferase [Aurantiacibacter spongiae]|uniref:Class I SAM-dependent methyltransferase n=1 Tax=Aurantiacibacter spongiae TaxID=2488860 RepID=A0A3N5CPM4_9SPHN|nr:cyclopropane-fatty-acyl-phospholipid synthase family protein [Aurantiacibacter spongiae]RPF70527.1 class I SAM-dependent methyltransferase [Aurantiacibacter spongiae]